MRARVSASQLDGGNITTRRIRADLMPIAGTRLIRDWQGVEQIVTVTQDGFEWQGRPARLEACPLPLAVSVRSRRPPVPETTCATLKWRQSAYSA